MLFFKHNLENVSKRRHSLKHDGGGLGWSVAESPRGGLDSETFRNDVSGRFEGNVRAICFVGILTESPSNAPNCTEGGGDLQGCCFQMVWILKHPKTMPLEYLQGHFSNHLPISKSQYTPLPKPQNIQGEYLTKCILGCWGQVF